MPRHLEGPGGREAVPGPRSGTVPLGSGGCRTSSVWRPGEHHRPRGTEGAHSVRVSCMWNVETPSGSSREAGRRTVRDAQLAGGNRMTREANAGMSKDDG